MSQTPPAVAGDEAEASPPDRSEPPPKAELPKRGWLWRHPLVNTLIGGLIAFGLTFAADQTNIINVNVPVLDQGPAVEDVVKENTGLREQVTALEDDNAILERTNQDLTTDKADLARQVEGLEERVRDLGGTSDDPDATYVDRQFTLDAIANDTDRPVVANLDAAEGQEMSYTLLWDDWIQTTVEGGPDPEDADLAIAGPFGHDVVMARTGVLASAEKAPTGREDCRAAAEEADGTETVEIPIDDMAEGDVVCLVTTADATARLVLTERTVRNSNARLTFEATLWAPTE